MIDIPGTTDKNTLLSKYFKLLAINIGYKLMLAIFLLSTLGIGLIYVSYEKTELSVWYYISQGVGNGILITAIITGAIKFYMSLQLKTYDEALKTELDKMKKEFLINEFDELKVIESKQTHLIGDNFSLLKALKDAGATWFYKNREEASSDIKKVIEQKPIKSIKIIGISLSDFLEDNITNFHSTWSTIERLIKGELDLPNDENKLSIKVLVIDPNCHGANLRIKAEETNDLNSTLFPDVVRAMNRFMSLKLIKSEKIDFDVRLYQSSPILFLFWTKNISFVQQYYFRPHHDPDINIPVIRYQMDVMVKENKVHNELEFHFDFLWKYASVSSEEYVGEHYRGTADGILSANIRQISYESEINKQRFISHIEKTKKTLWIKGVTLKSFFTSNSINNNLANIIGDAVARGVDVKVLLLHPTCEQAQYRSYREYLIPTKKGKKTFEQFKKSNDVLNQRIYTDFTHTKNYIESNFVEKNNFDAKLYECAPEAFILITDDVVMIEQYHYGKIYEERENIDRRVLGGNIPMTEYYNKNTAHTNLNTFDRAKDPYSILRNHFKHVYDDYSKDLLKTKLSKEMNNVDSPTNATSSLIEEMEDSE